MNKIVGSLLLVVAVIGIWYFGFSSDRSTDVSGDITSQQIAAGDRLQNDPFFDQAGRAEGDASPLDYLERLDALYENIRPATEIYSNAEEALAAIQQAAIDYDDIVLEQFVGLGDDCAWCDSLYRSVTDLMLSPDLDDDQRSFYAEVLAVSGRLENIETLVNAIKNESNSLTAEIYAEALELAVGNNDIVRYLDEQIASGNELLREAGIAAITGQGSRLAAETLYQHTLAGGDPDGFYSLGIGLGELIPEPEAMPYLQELAMKRDAYSHLAVKSLLNSGIDGLRIVFDVLTNSRDPEFDRLMLTDAADHVIYEEEIEAYLTNLVETSNQPLVSEFAREILDDFSLEMDDDFFDDDDDYFY